MDKAVYDTKEGIATKLGSLDDFRELIAARREAGYERHEELGNFWILGRFYTDSCGNVNCYRPDHFPLAMYATLPKVLTPNEFDELVKKYGVKSKDGWTGGSTYYVVAPPGIIDPVSGQAWTIENCHDLEVVEENHDVSLDPWVGKTYRALKQELAAKKDALHVLWEKEIWNESLIDVTQDPNDRGRPKNPEGWRPEEELTDDYVIQKGDRTRMSVTRFLHTESAKVYKSREVEADRSELAERLQAVLEMVGFTEVKIEFGEMPDYLIQMFTAECALDEENEEGGEDDVAMLKAECPYLKIRTQEGSFGCIVAAEGIPMVDLRGTGLIAHQITQEFGITLSPEEPPFLCGADERALGALRTLLLKKKK